MQILPLLDVSDLTQAIFDLEGSVASSAEAADKK
ncbi:hypothetical protein FB555_001589 [Alpinimonas psychrophila]|uniref:Uncharacterized protein n=1 Tax=Alpinimonas psychrophila TaxID=748908 RepID=A0A7W3JUK5_9MICO|nr:hypothetical protein [Alpinimonas psychrophila]